MASPPLITANSTPTLPEEQPISRTYQYRKVMKPMLERKRRARINRCLDELKELLVGALQAEGESVSRLEKADVLELTVRHLHKLRRANQLAEVTGAERYKSGFTRCATEVSKYVGSVANAGFNMSISSRLLAHLDGCIHRLHASTPQPPEVHLHQYHHHPTQQHMIMSSPPPHPSPINNYTPPSSPTSGVHPLSNSPTMITKGQIINLAKILPSPGQLPYNYRPSKYYNSNVHQLPMEEPFDLSNPSVWRPW